MYPDLLEQAGYHVGFTGKGWGPGDFKSGGFKRNPAGPEYNRHTARPPHRERVRHRLRPQLRRLPRGTQARPAVLLLVRRHEPHRDYEEGVGRRSGKDPKAVTLPAYYPDSDVIRNDMLDYAVEVEWFDTQLGRILEHARSRPASSTTRSCWSRRTTACRSRA